MMKLAWNGENESVKEFFDLWRSLDFDASTTMRFDRMILGEIFIRKIYIYIPIEASFLILRNDRIGPVEFSETANSFRDFERVS